MACSREPTEGPAALGSTAFKAQAAYVRLHGGQRQGRWANLSGIAVLDFTSNSRADKEQIWLVQTIQYSELMRQLDVSGVRQLEDLLITDCFYPQLLKGSLDQKARCLQVRHGVDHPLASMSMLCTAVGSIPDWRELLVNSNCLL